MQIHRTIIIDDEIDAVNYLKLLLNDLFKEIEIVGTAQSVKEGKKVILENNPDLVFLDIEMPDGNGFNLLEQLTEINFDVIFVTSYSHYAIQAIKYSAVDYILKPIDIEELQNSIRKIINKKQRKESTPDLSMLFENLKSSIPTKLALPTGKGIQYVNTNDIIRIEADRSYSNIHLTDGTSILVSRSLGEFNDLLTGKNFFRTHNSHLINLAHVQIYSKSDGGYIKMVDNSIVSISRNKKDIFLNEMKNFSINLNQ